MKILCWNDSRANREIDPDDVAIWYAWLDQIDPGPFEKILSADELMRAARYKNRDAANRFIIGRGILRTVLGRYLRIDKELLTFSSTRFGRPFLTGFSDKSVDFNVSHSGNLLAIAISATRKVGIDVECINEDIDTHAASAIVFSPEEVAFLNANENRTKKFYEIWTRKEAVLKSTGTGFSYPSTRFSVISSTSQSFTPWISGDVTGGNRCDLVQFFPYDGYSGALATINQ